MKAKTTGTYAIIALAAAVTAVLCLSRRAAVESVYPPEKIRRTLIDRVGSRVRGLFHAAEAEAENVRLRREVAALALSRTDAERTEVENARLRAALDYVAKAPETWLAAAVISRGGGASGARKTLRTDKGSLAGIREGAVAVVPEGLVGRVAWVSPHTSEILLITDPTLKVACEVAMPDGSRPRGILSGGTDDMLVIRHLKAAGEVPPRSKVISSGLGGLFPAGLEVGTLLDSRELEGVRKREGEVLPAVDFSTLEDVFIRREK